MSGDDPIAAMKQRWSYIQPFLFPFLREEVNPLTPKLEQLIVVLDTVGLEAYVRATPGGVGRPREDRRAIARAFIAKAVVGLPTTRALVERLHVDGALRRICGWERRAEIPSEATFSRAFSEFADHELPNRMHAALVERSFEGRIVGVVARDATEIQAREKNRRKGTTIRRRRHCRENPGAHAKTSRRQSRRRAGWSASSTKASRRCAGSSPQPVTSEPRRTARASRRAGSATRRILMSPAARSPFLSF